MKVVVVVLCVLAAFVGTCKGGFCVADESTVSADPADFLSADTWDCANDTDGIPDDDDLCLIRNVTVTLSGDALTIVQGLDILDAGGLEVIEDADFETGWLSVSGFSTVLVESTGTFDITPRRTANSGIQEFAYLVLAEGSLFSMDGDATLDVSNYGAAGNTYIRVTGGSVLSKTGRGYVLVQGYGLSGGSTYVSLSSSLFQVETSLQVYGPYVVFGNAPTRTQVALYDNSELTVGTRLVIKSAPAYYESQGPPAGLYLHDSAVSASAVVVYGGDVQGYDCGSSICSNDLGNGGVGFIETYFSSLVVSGNVTVRGGEGGGVSGRLAQAYSGNGGNSELTIYASYFAFDHVHVEGGVGGDGPELDGAYASVHGGSGGYAHFYVLRSEWVAGGDIYVLGGNGGDSSYVTGGGGQAYLVIRNGEGFVSGEELNEVTLIGGSVGTLLLGNSLARNIGNVQPFTGHGGEALLRVYSSFFATTGNVNVIGGNKGPVVVAYRFEDPVFFGSEGGEAIVDFGGSVVKIGGYTSVLGGDCAPSYRLTPALPFSAIRTDVVGASGGGAYMYVNKTTAVFNKEVRVKGGDGADAYGNYMGGGEGGEGCIYVLQHSTVLFADSLFVLGGSAAVNSVPLPFYVTAGEAQAYIDESCVHFEGDVTLAGGSGKPSLQDDHPYDAFTWYGTVAGSGSYAEMTIRYSSVYFRGNVVLEGGSGGDGGAFRNSGGYGGEALFYGLYSQIVIQEDGGGFFKVYGGDGGDGYHYYGYSGGYAYFKLYNSRFDLQTDDNLWILAGNGGNSLSYLSDNDFEGVSGAAGTVYAHLNSSYLNVGGNWIMIGGVEGEASRQTESVSDGELAYAQLIMDKVIVNVGGYLYLKGPTGGDIVNSYFAFYCSDTDTCAGNVKTGSGGPAILVMTHGSMDVGGLMYIHAGDGGNDYSVYNLYSEAGNGGTAKLYMGYFNVLSGGNGGNGGKGGRAEIGVGGSVEINGGRGGSKEDYLGEKGGDGGHAYFYFYSPSSLFVLSHFSLLAGDGGLLHIPPYYAFCSDGCPGGNGGNASLVGDAVAFESLVVQNNPFSTVYVGGDLWVGGGDGGAAGNGGRGGWGRVESVNLVVDGEVTIEGGDGGYAYASQTDIAAPILSYGGAAILFYSNVFAADLSIIAGDGGSGDFYFEESGYGGLAELRSFNNRVYIDGRVMVIGGDGGTAAVGGDGGEAKVRIQYGSIVLMSNDLEVEGGQGGRGYYGSGGVGGEAYVEVRSAILGIFGDLSISSANAGNAYRDSAGSAAPPFFHLIDAAVWASEADLHTGYGGSCTYSEISCSGGRISSIRAVIIDTSLFSSASLNVFGADAGVSYGNGAAANEDGLCGVIVFDGSTVAVSGGVYVGGLGGGSLKGNAPSLAQAGNTAVCSFRLQSASAIVRYFHITSPPGGDASKSASTFGGSVFELSGTVLAVTHGSQLIVKDNSYINTGPSGSGYAGPGFAQISQMLNVEFSSSAYFHRDLALTAPSLGVSYYHNGVTTYPGANSLVYVECASQLFVGGEFNISAGYSTDKGDGGVAALLVNYASTVQVVGRLDLDGGDGGNARGLDDGNGGDARIHVSVNSQLRVGDVDVDAGYGQYYGSAYIINDDLSSIVVFGFVTLNTDDGFLVQKSSDFLIYPCEEAGLALEGDNKHYFSSAFFDCRIDVPDLEILYTEPEGDEASSFDCTPCDCGDAVSDSSELCPEFFSPSPSPSVDPDASEPDLQSSSSSLSSFIHFILSYLS